MSDLSEEEKKAIEYVKAQKGIYYKTVINLIEKQEKTIKDLIKWRNYYKSLCNDIRKYKNKVIDEMAKALHLYIWTNDEKIMITSRPKDNFHSLSIEEIKQYFYRKVENNE